MDNSKENYDSIPIEGEVTDKILDQVSGGITLDSEDNLGGSVLKEVPFDKVEVGMRLFATRFSPPPVTYRGSVIAVEKLQELVTLMCHDGMHRVSAESFKFYQGY